MGKRNFVLELLLFISLIVGSGLKAQTAIKPNGAGTESDPYQISTLENLYWLSLSDTAWDKYYIQTANINAGPTSSWNNGSGFAPIGESYNHWFSGNYNGNEYIIDSLYINRPNTSYLGLFGYAYEASIQSLGVTNINISSSGSAINIGGLVGYAHGTNLTKCYSTGQVNGADSNTGGLVGYIFNEDINKCYSLCSVTGNERVGGLIGNTYIVNVDKCFSAGPVSGNTDVGGLMGMGTSVTTTNSFWDTEASGQNTSASDETGKTTSQMKNVSTYTYLSSDLSQAWDFTNNPYDDHSDYDIWRMDDYPAFTWRQLSGSGTSGDPYQISTLNDLKLFMNHPAQWDCYYIQTADIDAAATSSWFDGSGLSPIGNYDTKFKGQYNGRGYSIESLYIHRPYTNYIGLWGYVEKGKLDSIVVTNVDISGQNSVGGIVGYSDSSLVNNCYSSGHVNGSSNFGGLVGNNTNLAQVHMSHSSASVSGGSNAGGLVGDNNSATVSNCYSTGDIDGNDNIGGLIGENYWPAKVNDSYSKGNVNGSHRVGGLVGKDYVGEINNCYSIGAVSGDGEVGGLVGEQTSSTITNSFWDSDVSGNASSAGGTAKTTAEMKNVATFTDESTTGLTTAWDFVDNPYDDAANENYWDIDIAGVMNNGYPFLTWQDTTGGGVSSIGKNRLSVKEFSLEQNYPNPFNSSTSIRFVLAEASHVNLSVYDLLGRKVATLINGFKKAKSYRITWRANRFSSGLYLYILKAGPKIMSRRMLLLK